MKIDASCGAMHRQQQWLHLPKTEGCSLNIDYFRLLFSQFNHREHATKQVQA
jgi:hypothetical protein